MHENHLSCISFDLIGMLMSFLNKTINRPFNAELKFYKYTIGLGHLQKGVRYIEILYIFRQSRKFKSSVRSLLLKLNLYIQMVGDDLFFSKETANTKIGNQREAILFVWIIFYSTVA